MAKERMRQSALARGEREAVELVERVRSAMRTMQKELVDNDGIDPRNGGAVNLVEIATRAGIHENTFHKDRYSDLYIEVDGWLKSLSQQGPTSRLRVRKELGTRVKEWKELYDDLMESYRLSETDLMHANARLQELETENAELRAELIKAGQLRVVPFRPSSGPS